MFDPRNPYERRMWHYESDRPLSVAQLITLGSMDARVGALLWLLIERHTPYIISGPTDPTPGVGKTTTLNAMLDFLPNGSALVYTSGMFERFEFKELEEIEPAKTLVLCNEVSDHLRIYMWGRVARRFLDLPAEGYAIATSMHADTLDDVLDALMGDLHLTAGQTSRLGLIVNIGLVGRVWPPKRRFLTVNLLLPESPEDTSPQADGSKVTPLRQEREQVQILQLSRWVQQGDYFTTPDDATLAQVASFLKMDNAAFTAALQRRIDCLQELSEGSGANLRATRRAIADLSAAEELSSGQAEQEP
ncbi:MAG TPA: hypothetical protein VF099_02045 [Ktedonobacterales bacterium]